MKVEFYVACKLHPAPPSAGNGKLVHIVVAGDDETLSCYQQALTVILKAEGAANAEQLAREAFAAMHLSAFSPVCHALECADTIKLWFLIQE